MVAVGKREFDRALRDDLYEDTYYGPVQGDGPIRIGTDTYTRRTTHADVAAYLIWRFLPARRSLDVGCAFGFLVEAQRELEIDARGVDVSQFALDHAALGARGHVQYGSLRHRLPFRSSAFDLVSAFETLEHVPPDDVPRALRELRRVTSHYLIATIPSFGPNEHGPGGWFEAKVRPERLEYYRSLGDAFEGPVAHDDLARDDEGRPVEGHLTIASFSWWAKQFAAAGFVRMGDVERRMHPHLARFGLTKYWNLYVLRTPDAPPPPGDLRDPAEASGVEKRWELDQFTAHVDDVQRVKEVLGADAFAGVPLRFAESDPA